MASDLKSKRKKLANRGGSVFRRLALQYEALTGEELRATDDRQNIIALFLVGEEIVEAIKRRTESDV